MLHRGSRRVKRGDSHKEKERAKTRGKKRDGRDGCRVKRLTVRKSFGR